MKVAATHEAATTRIGFIGAGNMGGAVARRLATGGWSVRVHDPSAAAVERCVEAGAVAAADLADAVRDADVVVTSLPTPEVLENAVAEVLAVARPGVTLVDVSTVDPTTAVRIADRCAAVGGAFVACPLGKGPAQAEDGQVPLFVGGPPDAVARLAGFLDRIGAVTHDLGSVQAATTFKLVSNLVGMTNLAVLAEGYARARRAGIPDDVFDAALADTGGTSYQQQVRLPWIAKRDWSPRFGVDLALKDLRLAVDAASRWRLGVPVGAAAMAQLAAASSRGMGAEDVVALAKVVDPGLEEAP